MQAQSMHVKHEARAAYITCISAHMQPLVQISRNPNLSSRINGVWGPHMRDESSLTSNCATVLDVTYLGAQHLKSHKTCADKFVPLEGSKRLCADIRHGSLHRPQATCRKARQIKQRKRSSRRQLATACTSHGVTHAQISTNVLIDSVNPAGIYTAAYTPLYLAFVPVTSFLTKPNGVLESVIRGLTKLIPGGVVPENRTIPALAALYLVSLASITFTPRTR
jgi:hypothetical protein